MHDGSLGLFQFDRIDTAPAEAEAPPPHYLGHRDRLRLRARRAGPASLPDYELLELFLYRSIPRSDVKPLAKALLARFGGLAGVLGASIADLRQVPGVGEAVALDLKLMQEAALRMGREQLARRPLISSWSALLAYVRAELAHEAKEQFRVLFLDKKNRLIADEVQQKGTVDHTPVYPREVIKRTLELSATALILVHNHPSGDPSPSTADVQMTRQIIDVARPLGVTVHDHIIIGKSGHASMKGLRLI